LSFLDLPGVRLYYETVGQGPPLVLVHGSAVDGHTWDGVVPALSQNHTVITYDRRGYGESVHAPVRDHRLHANDLIAVLEKVAKQPARVGDLMNSLVIVEAPFHGQRHMNGAVLRTFCG
jgi:pimeloyl-ACP methyl ester carboxylesterase